MKKRASVALGIALLLLLLFILAVGWEDVLGALQRANLRIYAFAFVATLGCLFCRSLVWNQLLSAVDRPRQYWLISGLFLVSMFAKYVTPYGQVTSGVGVAAVVSRYYDSAYEEALAAVVSADFLNYLPYYTLGSVGLGYVVFVSAPPIDFGRYVPTAAVVIVAIVLIAIIAWLGRGLIRTVILRAIAGVRRVLSRVSPEKASYLRRENVIKRFEGFSTTLELVSQDRRAMGTALVYAHLGWLAYAVVLYVSAIAIEAPIAFGVAMLAVALSKVGFIIPTPGGLGGVEVALAGVLILITPMSSAVGVALALLYRFATYWFTILLGGIASILLTIKDPLPPEAE